MANRKVMVLSGVSLIAGGTTGIVAHILHLQYHPTHPAEVLPYIAKSEPVHLLLFAAVLLLMFGLTGLVARQGEKSGLVGLVGVVLVFFGLMFAEGMHCVLEFGIYPAMAHSVPNEIIGIIDKMYAGSPYSYLETAGSLILLLGAFTLGISILRAGVLPSWTAWSLFATDVAAVLAFLPPTHGLIGGRFPVLLYLAFVGIGYSVVRGAGFERRIQAKLAQGA